MREALLPGEPSRGCRTYGEGGREPSRRTAVVVGLQMWTSMCEGRTGCGELMAWIRCSAAALHPILFFCTWCCAYLLTNSGYGCSGAAMIHTCLVDNRRSYRIGV